MDTESIMGVLCSETYMKFLHHMRPFKSWNGLMVRVRCCGLASSETSSEPLQKIYEDIPELKLKLVGRKNSDADSVNKARCELPSSEKWKLVDSNHFFDSMRYSNTAA